MCFNMCKYVLICKNMYKYLTIIHNKSVPINIVTICLGFKYKYLKYADFKGYALLNFLSDDESLDAVNQGLLDARDEIELNEKVSKILAAKNENILHRESEKWLYAQLVELRLNELDDETLLNKIAEIYADFDYPSSMEHFINYMPSKIDLSGYTVEQAQKRLIGLCDIFINELEKKLTCGM